MRKRNDSCLNDNEKRLFDVTELCAYISMGKNNAVIFAREIGAERRIGRRCLYDKVHIDRYFDELLEIEKRHLVLDEY